MIPAGFYINFCNFNLLQSWQKNQGIPAVPFVGTKSKRRLDEGLLLSN